MQKIFLTYWRLLGSSCCQHCYKALCLYFEVDEHVDVEGHEHVDVGGREDAVDGHDDAALVLLEGHWWRLLNWSLAVAVVMVGVHLCVAAAEAALEAAVPAEEAFEETKAVGLYLEAAGLLYLTEQPHLH